MNDPLDPTRYPVHPWAFEQIGTPDQPIDDDPVGATLFALSNGYLGVRGDGEPDNLARATFINGFAETYPIHHAEDAYGLARIGQVIQPVPALDFDVKIGKTVLSEKTATRISDIRVLDFRDATVTRTTRWQLREGSVVEIVSTRLVSVDLTRVFSLQVQVSTTSAMPCRVAVQFNYRDRPEEPHTTAVTNDEDVSAAYEYPGGRFTVSEGPLAPVWERADVDPDDRGAVTLADPRQAEQHNGGLDRWWNAGGSWNPDSPSHGEPNCIGYRTRNSNLRLVVATDIPHADVAPLVAGKPVVRTAHLAYAAPDYEPIGVKPGSLRIATDDRNSFTPLRDTAWAALKQAQASSWDDLVAAQRAWFDDFWNSADIQIAGPELDRTQQAIRWSLFQLAQVSARIDGHGAGAKGLTGAGYSGHWFWDTEIFLMPFLTYTNPDRARALLSRRAAMLPAAFRRAGELDVAGALFPWRTITGDEASAYFPAGTAQYHIDADIAYATAQYLSLTGDRDFAHSQGLALLTETARMWASLVSQGRDGLFHLNTVTGPDEYSAIVDDNFFTNAMAQKNLRAAAQLVFELQVPSLQDEAVHWSEIAERMYLGWDETLGIHPQDARFLEHERWPADQIPADKHPLLMHYHSLVIYRHQVLKQADVVLALLLLADQFTPEQKRADFAYYDPLTTGDSSLSAPTQAVLAAETGHQELALAHFANTLFTDLADSHHNTADGVHIASVAGLWGILVQGFGGLRDSAVWPSLDPHLPHDWDSLKFRLRIRNSLVEVTITHDGPNLKLLEGDPVKIKVSGNDTLVK